MTTMKIDQTLVFDDETKVVTFELTNIFLIVHKNENEKVYISETQACELADHILLRFRGAQQ
jgi:hypothetical protein